MEPIIKADLENIIINLLQKCQLEGDTPMQIPLEDVERRVLHYSEISRNKLEIAIGRYSSTKCRINHCVDFGKHVTVLNNLLYFYEKKMLPSFKTLFDYIQILEPSTRGMNYYHFIHNMNMIGIDHQTIINGKMLLMEDPKITFERSLFLNKMKKIRQSDLMIYYVSERIIDDKCNFEKPWVRNCKTLKLFTNGHIFFHAVSKQGFMNGIFCYTPTEYDFYKWIVDILLPSLKTESVIVFDNSPLHGTSKPNKVSMFDTKDEMRKWLRENNIPHTNSMKKSELYRLIENCMCSMNTTPQVDRVIKANGHQVVRLPTHFEDLSPIDQIWQDIKKFQSLSQADLHNSILKYFLEIPTVVYTQLYDKVVKKENTLIELDDKIEHALDEFLKELKITEIVLE
ncbi:uncharacterized protein LOC118269981 [Spodoptera frugiperda]|uniref:Uncharacterized protein LOC118269981 n=1 Tax=Spodoptera frugiperda TaxID=7108 RepID=A0A9R0EKK0_SPOFR|nr:uncharacterized protein LOC118269981 [Spodoptera frugiperda]XP_035441279.2 uncharacterized protein LOC118269981 [Spodoptera frugiperda]